MFNAHGQDVDSVGLVVDFVKDAKPIIWAKANVMKRFPKELW